MPDVDGRTISGRRVETVRLEGRIEADGLPHAVQVLHGAGQVEVGYLGRAGNAQLGAQDDHGPHKVGLEVDGQRRGHEGGRIRVGSGAPVTAHLNAELSRLGRRQRQVQHGVLGRVIDAVHGNDDGPGALPVECAYPCPGEGAFAVRVVPLAGDWPSIDPRKARFRWCDPLDGPARRVQEADGDALPRVEPGQREADIVAGKRLSRLDPERHVAEHRDVDAAGYVRFAHGARRARHGGQCHRHGGLYRLVHERARLLHGHGGSRYRRWGGYGVDGSRYPRVHLVQRGARRGSGGVRKALDLDLEAFEGLADATHGLLQLVDARVRGWSGRGLGAPGHKQADGR